MDLAEAERLLDIEVTGNSPEMRRARAVDRLLEPATSPALARLSTEMMIFESLLEATEHLGESQPLPEKGAIPLRFPAARHFAKTVREMTPGLDGLGRGETVRVLEAGSKQIPTYYPMPGVPAGDRGPGLFERISAFFGGGKKSGGSDD